MGLIITGAISTGGLAALKVSRKNRAGEILANSSDEREKSKWQRARLRSRK
jgi:hypothetical protein